VSQVIAGYDENAMITRLGEHTLGIGFSKAAAASSEGRMLLDLLVRIAARLYPSISLQPGIGADGLARDLAELARAINPAITLDSATPTLGVRVGPGNAPAATTIFAGSDQWCGTVSAKSSLRLGPSQNPFGPGVAACLAMADVFRAAFLDQPELDVNLRLSALPFPGIEPPPITNVGLGEFALIGVGAVGNAALWALSRAHVTGRIHLVDSEEVDLGNLQRYVLANRADDASAKVDLAAREVGPRLAVNVHRQRFAEFAEMLGEYRLPTLVAVDSARDRRQVQAALPPWVANAWTQPGDLGVSDHDFGGDGACLACLYLPTGVTPSEDQLYAQALGIPEQIMQVRSLLYQQVPVPDQMLGLIAERLGVSVADAMQFSGVEIRKLYVEGVCGGALLPLGRQGKPRGDVHVPLAHQSVLAGVLLAARLVAKSAGLRWEGTLVTRVDLMRAVQAAFVTQRAGKDPRGLCICQDLDYRSVFESKYPGN
jgi:hypothetical protein